jgi:L-threonylcarbamoyladenylate synthase
VSPHIQTEVLRVDASAPDPTLIARAAALLTAGRLVAFPTETVYGLGAHALDPDAVARIFAAKGRPSNDPLIVHVSGVADLDALVARVPAVALTLAERFWPGPLTLVLPKRNVVPDIVTAGLATVGIRVPAHPVARALLEAAKLPIAASSANLFSRPSPTRASHVADDLGGRIDLIVDGGETHVGLESTVLDVTGERPTVLRPGGVSLESLRDLLGDVRLSEHAQSAVDTAAMSAPGLLSRHYSPRTPLTLFEGDPARALARLREAEQEAITAGHRVAILDLGEHTDYPRIAAELFTRLRDLDVSGADLILVRGVAGTEVLPAPTGSGGRFRTGCGAPPQDTLSR